MKKISPIRDQDRLSYVVSIATSQADALKLLGLRAAGGNYKALKQAVKDFGLILPKRDTTTYEKTEQRQYSNEDIFIENSQYSNRQHIKKKNV